MRLRVVSYFYLTTIINNFIMMRFSEFVQIKEGLWLNDKNAVLGLSKLPLPPTPPKKKKSVAALPKPIVPIQPKPPRFGLFQRQ